MGKARNRRRKIAKDYAELAEEFGVRVSTIAKWRTAGMPGRKGHYDIAEIDRWVTINGKGKKPEKKLAESELAEEAERAAKIERIKKADKVEAEAAILQRKNRAEQANLVRLSDVENFIDNFLAKLKECCDKSVKSFMGSKLVLSLGNEFSRDITEDLKARYDLILNQLGAYRERAADLQEFGK